MSTSVSTISTGERIGIGLGVILPIVALLGICIGWWGQGIDLVTVILFIVFWVFTGLSVTIGFHRCFTHGSFVIKKRWLKVLLAIGGSMSMQGPVIVWVCWHWAHHADTEGETDPHSPHRYGKGFWNKVRGFFHAHFFWLFNPPPISKKKKDLCKDRDLIKISRQFWLWVFVGLTLPAILGVLIRQSFDHFSTDFLLNGVIRVGFLQHGTWMVNSIGHLLGRRDFNTDDESRNVWWLALITFGEGWHNNHHHLMSSARHGFRWWQVDFSWYVICLLYKLGLISKPKVPN